MCDLVIRYAHEYTTVEDWVTYFSLTCLWETDWGLKNNLFTLTSHNKKCSNINRYAFIAHSFVDVTQNTIRQHVNVTLLSLS